jgi:hypothetical protein
MKHSKTLFLGFVLFSGWAYALTDQEIDEKDWPERSRHNREIVAGALRPILQSMRVGARIDYQAVCRETSDHQKTVWFPSLTVQAPQKGVTGLRVVRRLFKNDRNVVVSQALPGVIRIKIGTVRAALLRTRIPLLKLDQREQYDPETALSALEITSEFESAVDKLHLFNMPVLVSGPIPDPEPHLPHLPSIMKDVTVDQVLDAIAKAFGGIIAYGECINPIDKTVCFSLTYIDAKVLNLPSSDRRRSEEGPGGIKAVRGSISSRQKDLEGVR